MCRLSPLAAVLAAAAVAVLAAPEAAAQTTSAPTPGAACPQPPTQANFDAQGYLGSWYEMKRVPRNFEDDGECGMAQYSWVDDTKAAINVINTNFVPQNLTVGSVNLLATPVDLANGKLSVKFPSLPFIPGSMYWVLGTDYTTYAVVYSCMEVPNAAVPHVTLWVLARSPDKYTAGVDGKVLDIISKAGLDGSILKTVAHHQGCPAATCKACPTAKAGLDLAKMKGLWSEVQHSPFATDSDKQTCSLAEFTATTDGVKMTATTFEMSSTGTGADKTMELTGKWSNATKKDGAFDSDQTSGGKICLLDTDYDNWAVMSICLPATPTTTAAPVGPFASGVPVASGGVFVLARKRGLTAAQQMEANKAVVSAGIPAASMQATPSTPCPKAALTGNGAAAATPAVLLLAALAAALAHFRP